MRPADDGEASPEHVTAPRVRLVDPPPGQRTDSGWPLTPSGFTELLERIRRDHPDHPPIYVTENGAGYDDPLVDGRCDDRRRMAFLDSYLRAAHDAISAGVDIRGYFVWSLLDNFEWAQGYAVRFGITHVDFATQRRTPKSSAHWLRDVIRANALPERDPSFSADLTGR